MSNPVNDKRNRPRRLPPETARKLEDAKALLTESYPYWGIELHSIPWYRAYPDEVTPESPMGISDTGIGVICPEYVDNIPVKEFATDYLHQYGHIVTDSAERARALGQAELKEAHGLAQDLAINSWIEDSVQNNKLLTLPKNFILPQQLGYPVKKSYEEYFGMVLKNPPPQLQDPDQEGKGKKGKGKGKPQPGDGDGQGQGQPKPRGGLGHGNCNCGDNDPNSPANRIARQLSGSPDLSQQEKEDLQGRGRESMDEIAKSMKDRAEAAGADPNGQMAGKGSLQNILPVAKVEPTIDWNEYLRRIYLKATRYVAGYAENNWKKPSRRSPSNVFIPTTRRRIPLIDAAMDTSGSMYGGPLAEACAEIFKVIQTTGSKMRVFYCDDDITNIAEVSTWEALAEGVKGGGGTGFSAVFDYIAKIPADRRTKVLTFVTDGYVSPNDIPAVCPPGLHVVWVITRNGQKPPCNWGDVVQIGQKYKASAGL